MTVFGAAPGYAACLVREWLPTDGALALELSPRPRGGSVIFPEATGHLPGLKGRLNPIRDTLDRTYLYAANIAIGQGRQQPVHFVPGEELRLTELGRRGAPRAHRRCRRPFRAGRVSSAGTVTAACVGACARRRLGLPPRDTATRCRGSRRLARLLTIGRPITDALGDPSTARECAGVCSHAEWQPYWRTARSVLKPNMLGHKLAPTTTY